MKKDVLDMAEVVIYAEAKLGGILKAIPKVGNTLTSGGGRKGTLPDGISHKESHFAQTIADNPGAVEETIAEAREKDKIPTSWDVLKNVHKQEQKEASTKPLITTGKYRTVGQKKTLPMMGKVSNSTF